MSLPRIEIATEDGAVDAVVAAPSVPGRHTPILLLGDCDGLSKTTESRAIRLSAHSFFVLAPDLSGLSAEDRREGAWAALDHLADLPGVDDTRVGVLGFGSGADLALVLAGWRAERIGAVAAYGGRGFAPRTAIEIAHRINGFVRIGYRVGQVPTRAGFLETALSLAGVLFDSEAFEDEPAWPGLVDLFGRALAPPAAAAGASGEDRRPTLTP